MAGREDVFQKSMNDGHSAAWDQNWEQAAKAYRLALAEFPDNPKAVTSLGLALFQMQKLDEALKVYIRAAQLTPQDPTPFEKLAQIQERQGNLKEAVQVALQAAELYFNARDVEKAMENWLRVVQLNPENVQARSRLALVHEKTNQIPQAITEYIAVASILQNAGNAPKAMEIVEHALKLDPTHAEARQAQSLMKSGRLLPKPARPKGGTGPLRMAQVKQLEAPKKEIKESPDPIMEARKKALNSLADALFELSDEGGGDTRRGMQALIRGTGQLLSSQTEQTRIMIHLSQAIDSQTKGKDDDAAINLEQAIESGLTLHSAYYNLGMLLATTSQYDKALSYLQKCSRSAEYELASRLLIAQIYQSAGHIKDAAIESLEALKIADASVVSPEQADSIMQLYEPLIEGLGQDNDEKALIKLCSNVQEILVRKNWRAYILKLREKLPSMEGNATLPLAEIIIQAQSSQVIEAMNQINQLARANRLRSAMDEAFYTLTYAPTYLPLHTLIGDLLIREGRSQDAIVKYTMIANAYSVRGEANQATNLLRKIIQISPMDMAARTRLIDQLTARGQMNDAIIEYMELAEIHYRLAELDMARKTYTTALRLAQQPNADHAWSIRVLRRMADIDMQRLDWKQATRVYEQIRTSRPDDTDSRESLIELHLRMGQTAQVQAEIDSFVSYMESHKRMPEAVDFMVKICENNDNMILKRELASVYYRAGRLNDAVATLDSVVKELMEAKNRDVATEVITQILAMNPPNAPEYRNRLAQLRGN